MFGLAEGSDLWLIGATGGHAKNISVFLGAGGTYRLTPLYDILSAQPKAGRGQCGAGTLPVPLIETLFGEAA